jgi:hypothetical protein
METLQPALIAAMERAFALLSQGIGDHGARRSSAHE